MVFTQKNAIEARAIVQFFFACVFDYMIMTMTQSHWTDALFYIRIRIR